MAVNLPTKRQLRRELQAYLVSRIPEINASDDSDAGILIGMFAEAIYGLYVNNQAIFDDLFVSAKTSSEALDNHAEARLGANARKGATVSSAFLSVKIYGTDGSILPVLSELVSGEGIRYQTQTETTIASGEGVVTSIESIDTGTTANIDSGSTLTISSPPSGVEASADAILDITGATDGESDAALLRRLLDAYQNPPSVGTFSDFRQIATSIAGCDDAYVYGPSTLSPTGRRGLGAVDVVILSDGSGTGRIPPESVRLAVAAEIETQRRVIASDYSVYVPTNINLSPVISFKGTSDYPTDWGTDGTSYSTTGYSSSTKTLTFAPIPADLAIGDRIHCNGRVAEVVSIASNDVVLDTDIVTYGPVWAASDLTQSVIDAIVAYVDSLGPSNASGALNPNRTVDDTYRIASVYDAVMSVDGVLDCDVEGTNFQAPDDAVFVFGLHTVGQVFAKTMA